MCNVLFDIVEPKQIKTKTPKQTDFCQIQRKFQIKKFCLLVHDYVTSQTLTPIFSESIKAHIEPF